MNYKILIANEKTWMKDISQLSKKEQQTIIHKIQDLTNTPWPESVQVKKLKHHNLANFRLRIGHYRVLFDRDLFNKEIILYRILHQSCAYK